jgi:HPt (histidine-containing phosphotransfer) domain-containing protein
MMHAQRPIDLEHLDRYTGGDAALNREILGLFDNQCHEILIKLEQLAVEHHDGKSWRELVHTLKGAARGVGAFALADAAAEAEKPDQGKTAILAALHQIKSKSCAVTLFIEEFLKHGG